MSVLHEPRAFDRQDRDIGYGATILTFAFVGVSLCRMLVGKNRSIFVLNLPPHADYTPAIESALSTAMMGES